MKSAYNVLSLNGGGIKGLKSLVQLVQIESRLGGNLLDYFDLISGTSTGGIIAAMLACGYKASDIMKLYTEHGEAIFKKRFLHKMRSQRYDDTYINNLLAFYFGEKELCELKCDVLIPAYNGTTRKFVYFKRTGSTSNWLVRDAVRATMSAQTYFKPFVKDGNMFLDGGNGLNNPSEIALKEAKRICQSGEVINLLSIGTGKVEKPIKKNQWMIGWAKDTVDMLMTESDQLTQEGVDYEYKHKSGSSNLGVYLFCDSVVTHSSVEMDDASKENIEALINDGHISYQNNSQAITEFIQEIKKSRL